MEANQATQNYAGYPAKPDVSHRGDGRRSNGTGGLADHYTAACAKLYRLRQMLLSPDSLLNLSATDGKIMELLCNTFLSEFVTGYMTYL